ncbi:PrsW family intramembrane metalloprotease [Actinomycetospora sp. TBRC 11914]|uniref:PrsW family intramembrane metalloprotease n=1 Tax=Actinomycetospora sp. TBRC 11914 TaxID=2729387 RepID=UPI00289A52A8|nr:PrsW family intramembrane metalloprotease [Actinomycetospora sp. TBRC 11914]
MAATSRLLRHAWLLVLVIGVALFVLDERTMVATRNPNFVPSAILLGSAVVPFTFVTFIKGRRLPYAVSGGLLASAAFFGGVLGTIVAGTLEFDVEQRLGALPMIGVAVIEEGAKLLVPLVLLLVLRHRFGPADGLLLGVACGAGFAALETMGYGFVTLLESHGSVVSTVDVLMLRGLMSPAGHMAWTGITAAALYAVPGAVHHGRAVGRFVLAYIVAVALHTAWDSLGGVVAYVVLAVLSLGLLTYIAHRIAEGEAHVNERGRPNDHIRSHA